MTTVKIVSAAPQNLLSKLNERGIALYNIQYLDDLTVVASVQQRDCLYLRNLADRNGCNIEITENKGLNVFTKRLITRPVLLAGCLIWIFLLLYLPSRVLFVEVRGNHNIPANMIVEKAELCGVAFGTSRRGIRNEQIKNTLISQIPQLQWVGVNTYGCVAVISVEEKTDDENQRQQPGVSSIVACHDGIVTDITVERGSPTCAVGQAVTKGQILISGFTDCGLSVKAERASGAVYANTMREVTAVTPLVSAKRAAQKKEVVKYSIKIGKNIINLSKDSGISDTTCAKIHTESSLVLPGGFALPVSVIRETCIYYGYSCRVDEDVDDYAWLMQLAEDYLSAQTIDATLLSHGYSYTESNGAVHFKGLYLCREMIGRERYEEIYNGERND